MRIDHSESEVFILEYLFDFRFVFFRYRRHLYLCKFWIVMLLFHWQTVRYHREFFILFSLNVYLVCSFLLSLILAWNKLIEIFSRIFFSSLPLFTTSFWFHFYFFGQGFFSLLLCDEKKLPLVWTSVLNNHRRSKKRQDEWEWRIYTCSTTSLCGDSKIRMDNIAYAYAKKWRRITWKSS